MKTLNVCAGAPSKHAHRKSNLELALSLERSNGRKTREKLDT